MQFSFIFYLTSALISTATAARVLGQDVSNNQGSINWKSQASAGSKFAWSKATEGTTFIDKYFNANYKGSLDNGIIHGAYHYAHPSNSATKECQFFLAHGGKWSADGKTLPGGLDLEYGTKAQGGTCWGVSQANMVKWIHTFGNCYKKSTGRFPVIYTTDNWWKSCTGDPKGEFKDYPFWIAHPSGNSVGPTPKSGTTSFWQFGANTKGLKGDLNYWLGSEASLKKFVKG